MMRTSQSISSRWISPAPAGVSKVSSLYLGLNYYLIQKNGATRWVKDTDKDSKRPFAYASQENIARKKAKKTRPFTGREQKAPGMAPKNLVIDLYNTSLFLPPSEDGSLSISLKYWRSSKRREICFSASGRIS